MKVPGAYYILYCFVVTTSFLWDVLYHRPNVVGIIVKGETHLYRDYPVSRMGEFVGFTLILLIPGILLTLFSSGAVFLKRNPKIEKTCCFFFFILLVSLTLINPFANIREIELINSLNLAVFLATFVSSVEMILCFILDRPTVKNTLINVAIFTVVPCFIFLVVLPILLYVFFDKMLALEGVRYEPIFSAIDRSSEMGRAIADFSKRHQFEESRIYAEKNEEGFSEAFILRTGIKSLSMILIGADLIKYFTTDEIIGLLEHTIGYLRHIFILNHLFMILSVGLTFFYFISKKILSDPKNFKIKKFAENVMKLVVFLKLISLVYTFSHRVLEFEIDRQVFSNESTCAGIGSALVKKLIGYSISNNTYVLGAQENGIFQPYSMYVQETPYYQRLLNAYKKCSDKIKVRPFYLH